MPELPEVDTIRRQMEELVIGKKIKKNEILSPKTIKTAIFDFEKSITGSKISRIWRRAKILIFELDNGKSLLIHLKLTGQVIFNGEKNSHTRVIFYFSDNSRLLFNDMRKFGYIKLFKTEYLEKFFEKEKFGPEPLDKNFKLENLKNILEKRSKAKIKQFLMDQKNIAGIGNIYSDEILFEAGVHPLRQNNSLGEDEIKKIFKAISSVLFKALKYKGTSTSDYLDSFGEKGDFAKFLKVYGRESEKCQKCKSEIKRIKIGGRSAHFCPQCQK